MRLLEEIYLLADEIKSSLRSAHIRIDPSINVTLPKEHTAKDLADFTNTLSNFNYSQEHGHGIIKGVLVFDSGVIYKRGLVGNLETWIPLKG